MLCCINKVILVKIVLSIITVLKTITFATKPNIIFQRRKAIKDAPDSAIGSTREIGKKEAQKREKLPRPEISERHK